MSKPGEINYTVGGNIQVIFNHGIDLVFQGSQERSLVLWKSQDDGDRGEVFEFSREQTKAVSRHLMPLALDGDEIERCGRLLARAVGWEYEPEGGADHIVFEIMVMLGIAPMTESYRRLYADILAMDILVDTEESK